MAALSNPEDDDVAAVEPAEISRAAGRSGQLKERLVRQFRQRIVDEVERADLAGRQAYPIEALHISLHKTVPLKGYEHASHGCARLSNSASDLSHAEFGACSI